MSSGETEIWSDPGYLDTLSHPYFQAVAQQILRAEAACIIETHIHDRAPGTGGTSWGGGHLDVQLTRSDWDATPRRDQISIWLFCNGVPRNRGVRPHPPAPCRGPSHPLAPCRGRCRWARRG